MITVGSWLGRPLQDVPAHIIPYHHTQEYHTIIPKNNIPYLRMVHHTIPYDKKYPTLLYNIKTTPHMYPLENFPGQIITPALITALPHLASFHSSTISFPLKTKIVLLNYPQTILKLYMLYKSTITQCHRVDGVVSLQVLARTIVQPGPGPWSGQANCCPGDSSSLTPTTNVNVIDIIIVVRRIG